MSVYQTSIAALFKIGALKYTYERKNGSCLLQVVSTDLSVDIAVDSRSTLGRYSGRQSVDSRSIVSRSWDRLSAEYRSIFRRRTSTDYRSFVGDISVNCRWYIGQLSVEYQSCVNLAGESNPTGADIKCLVKFMCNYIWNCSGVFSISQLVRILTTSFPAIERLPIVAKWWSKTGQKIYMLYILKHILKRFTL